MSDPEDDGVAASATRNSEAHGQAALVLVESLIHALLARSVLSIVDVLEIVQVAVDTQVELDRENRAEQRPESAVTLLLKIGNSLRPEIDPAGDRTP